MECKTVPKQPETTIDLITQLDRKKGTSCSRYGFKFCLGILSFLSLAYCIYLHYSYINLMKQLQDIKDNAESSNQPATMVKRQMDLEDRRHRRRGRNRRELLQTLKNKMEDLEKLPMVVHLTGNTSYGTTYNPNGCLYNQQCFLWKYPLDFGNEMQYEYVSGKVVGVKITRAGYYFVYSQIKVAGLKDEQNIPTAPAFGYETIKRKNGITTTLSQSFVTQDERGQWYDQADQLGPLDTMNQMGVFRLDCNEVVMVRSSEQSNYHNIKFQQSPYMSYFGLILLRPGELGNQGCLRSTP